MKQLLRFEFYKLFRQKSLYICLGISLVFLAISIYSSYALMQLMLDEMAMEMGPEMGEIFGLSSGDFFTGAYFLINAIPSASLPLLLPIVISLFVCSDYQNGAIKTVESIGYSRSKIYFAKYLAVVWISVFFSYVAVFFGWILGSLLFGIGTDYSYRMLLHLLLQILVAIALSTLTFFFAQWFRKATGAIACGILIPGFIASILEFIELLNYEKDLKLTPYWFSSALAELSDLSLTNTDLLRIGLVTLGYILLFVILGLFIARKKEV